MNLTDNLAIYRNRRTGEYRIQPFGRLQNGTSQPFGDQVHLMPEVTSEQLLTTVLQNLAKNSKQVYRKELEPKISDAEWRRQVKEDQLIDVERSESGYRVIPSRRKGSGFGSIDEMIFTVSKEEFLNRGGEIIRTLFEEIP